MEKEVYNLAEKKRKENKIEEAIPLYEFLTNNSDYNDVACNRLMRIYIEKNSLDLARKVSNKVIDRNHLAFFDQLGYLEYCEMNYQASLKLRKNNINNSLAQEVYIYMLANIERNYGEKKVATNLYELLLNSKIYGWRAFTSLTALDLENHNYKQLEKRWNQIDTTKLVGKGKMEWLFYREILDYYLRGEVSQTLSYLAKRFIENKEEDLLEHLEKHRASTQIGDDSFLKYINFKALIKLATEKIALSNPHFDAKNLNYIISADSIIGIKNKKTTNTFKAITVCGSPNIITMYPISVSEEFNKEGFREDQTILAKRLGGGQAR